MTAGDGATSGHPGAYCPPPKCALNGSRPPKPASTGGGNGPRLGGEPSAARMSTNAATSAVWRVRRPACAWTPAGSVRAICALRLLRHAHMPPTPATCGAHASARARAPLGAAHRPGHMPTVLRPPSTPQAHGQRAAGACRAPTEPPVRHTNTPPARGPRGAGQPPAHQLARLPCAARAQPVRRTCAACAPVAVGSTNRERPLLTQFVFARTQTVASRARNWPVATAWPVAALLLAAFPWRSPLP